MDLKAFTAALLVLSLLPGQQPPTFSSDVKVVNVLATVRNKQGQIAQNLTKDDFVLEEDGHPQTIHYFARETDLPLTMGLLVDTSGSQRRVLGAESRASYEFLQQVLREDKDMAFVIHFDREVELLQDLTGSRKQLQAALDGMDSPQPRQWNGGGHGGYGGGRRRGGTSLYDAVLLASDELMAKQHGRKALIMLSDGVDNGSRVTLEKAIESAQRADTLVYSILFADEQAYGRPAMGGHGGGHGRYPPMVRPDGKKILQRLAKETGGGFFEVSKKESIEKVFSRIQEELRSQYSLGYTSDQTQAGAGYRKIRLSTRQKGFVVQTRDGYYAKL